MNIPRTNTRHRRSTVARSAASEECDLKETRREVRKTSRAKTRWLTLACVAVLSVLATDSSITFAQDEELQFEQIGIWGGMINACEVVEGFAYTGQGRKLTILDVSDPSDMVEVGFIDLNSFIHDLKVRDGYAYVGTHGDPYQFCVVDVSNPAAPELVWFHDSSIQERHGEVDLYGNYAYVTSDYTGGDYEVFDISNPLAPVWMGESDFDQNNRRGVALEIRGDLAYMSTSLTGGTGAFQIFQLDPEDPLHPVLLSVIDGPVFDGRQPWDLGLEGDLACIVVQNSYPDTGDSVVVVNVVDPEAPFVAGEYSDFPAPDGPDIGVHITFGSGIAYVHQVYGPENVNGEYPLNLGLTVLDIATDPSNPTLITTLKTRCSILGHVIDGNTLYLRDEEGLISVDVTDPSTPTPLDLFYSPTVMRRVEKSGDYLYVVDGWGGFAVLDVSNPAVPPLAARYKTEWDPDGYFSDSWDLVIHNDRLCLGAGLAGLEVFDISDPTNPQLLGRVEDWPRNGVRSQAVALDPTGTIAHIGTRPGVYLVNFDITNPGGIVELGSTVLGCGTGTRMHDLIRTADGICHAATSCSIFTLDVSNAAEDPILLSRYDGYAWMNLDRTGNLLYVASASAFEDEFGVNILDASNPENLVRLGRRPLRDCHAVTVIDDRLLTCGHPNSGETSLFAYHPTNPQPPLGQIELNQTGYHMLANSMHQYIIGKDNVSHGSIGLRVYEMTGARSMVLADPIPGVANTLNVFSVSGAVDGHRVYFAYALQSGSTGVPGCPGLVVDLKNPKVMGSDIADPNGDASISIFVPNAASGRTIYFQAADKDACEVSNLVTFTFQ